MLSTDISQSLGNQILADIKAMGSMPEERKCLGFIGCPIDESKWHLLGKCSWVLKGLLLELEVKQIMESELSCPANQLPPEQIFVNDRPLYLEKLMLLRSCPNPLRNLNQDTIGIIESPIFWERYIWILLSFHHFNTE